MLFRLIYCKLNVNSIITNLRQIVNTNYTILLELPLYSILVANVTSEDLDQLMF